MYNDFKYWIMPLPPGYIKFKELIQLNSTPNRKKLQTTRDGLQLLLGT